MLCVPGKKKEENNNNNLIKSLQVQLTQRPLRPLICHIFTFSMTRNMMHCDITPPGHTDHSMCPYCMQRLQFTGHWWCWMPRPRLSNCHYQSVKVKPRKQVTFRAEPCSCSSHQPISSSCGPYVYRDIIVILRVFSSKISVVKFGD